ncbi:MAG: hypothetical protein AABY13_03370 [Nanoarchaeota archaeon]
METTLLTYVVLFFTFGLLGWVIDTTYQRIIDGYWLSHTYIPFFAVIYAIGGTTLVLFYQTVTLLPAAQVMSATVMLTLIELIGGVFSVTVLNVRLWDYSHHALNFMGHIDALHTFYWFLFALGFRIIMMYV